MRILLLTHYFSPEQGAPQRRWEAFIREFVAAGHDVRVICPTPHYPDGRAPSEFRERLRAGTTAQHESGAVVHRVGWLPHRGDIATRTLDHLYAARAMYRRARRLLRNGWRPDVVVATAPAVPTLIAGRVLQWREGTPLVAEMRDAWPDLVTHTGPVTGTGVIARAKREVHEAVTWLQRNATRVVTTTESFAQVLTERGIPYVDVIRNGTNPERFEQVPARVNDHNELRLLYMGTIGRSQGLDVVVRAVARLKALGAPVHARIIGAGHERSPLMRLNNALGFPVEFLPTVNHSEVTEYYAWADSTIVSLRDWEPFAWTIPSKLYELLSSGRHITGILAGESAEILRRADAGTGVPPGDIDELVRVWQGLTLDRAPLDVGTSGRDWARRHVAHASLAARYLEVLEEATYEASPTRK